MMEGFGVHTFKFINKEGKVHFVKFQWKPVLGVHGVTWDEAQKISGKNADFHREDLWEAIEKGNGPEWEFGVQIIPEDKEFDFDFDILDPTKLIPEEIVPVEIIGKMKLTKNPDNFFAEVEQSAFHPGNIVPGIDFSNDPLLQGRLFSYSDTQIYRLGGSNFNQIPINQPLHTPANTIRDGTAQHMVHKGKGHYSPNSTAGGCPFLAKAMEGGFVSAGERIDAHKVRARSDSFRDHYSQATLFYNSQSEYEQQHIKDAISFELSMVKDENIRKRVVQQISNIDLDLAGYVAGKLGLEAPKKAVPVENHVRSADETPEDVATIVKEQKLKKSDALKMIRDEKSSIATRKVAGFLTDGFDGKSFQKVKKALEKEGAELVPVGPRTGKIKADDGTVAEVNDTFFNAASVLFDGLYIFGGEDCVKEIAKNPNTAEFADDTIKHCKPIGGDKAAEILLSETRLYKKIKDGDAGCITDGNAEAFTEAMKHHRIWERESKL